MNDDRNEDGRLRQLLATARPAVDLPPGFVGQVWRRIEQREPAGSDFWAALAGWFLKPKVAWAGLAALLLLAGAFGAARGLQAGEDLARARYLASVDPAYAVHAR